MTESPLTSDSETTSELPELPNEAVTVEPVVAMTESSEPDTAALPTASEEERPKVPAGFPEMIEMDALQTASFAELHAIAEKTGWRVNASRSKHQLIYDLAGWLSYHGTQLVVEGVLEIGADHFGLVRYPRFSATPLPEDIFVPLFLVRKFDLRSGQKIKGLARPPRDRDKFLAIERILCVEDVEIDKWQTPIHFDKLTAMFPNERIILETPKDASMSARVVDLVAPLGKGQRGLICASPRSGKTMLLKEIAKSIIVNHKEIELLILLLDERPEEVTDFEETVAGGQIYASTFDESPKRHSQLAELVIERAKRLVESGKDVVILLDSITRLARAYNTVAPASGKILSGGVDANALHKPKRFFGAARNIENGGSLTIIATALIDTGSKMDEVIFEEFKGTGNMELQLDRKLSNRRIYPAIDVMTSSTRRDDLLHRKEVLQRMYILRNHLNDMSNTEAMGFLLSQMKGTLSNEEFLVSMGR
jgi:transcription termination factor Rho